MGMRLRVAGFTLLGLALTAGRPVRAQMGGGDPGQENGPAMAMGSGRMVRGTVSAVAADKVTVKTDSGDVYTIALSANTGLMKARNPIKIGEVKVGDGIGAMGEMDQPTKTVHALFVTVVDAAEAQKLKESYGKTWISGKVTAMEETKLTILRGDKVTQVIQVDEDTSFKRGGRGLQMAMQGEGGGGGYGGGRPRAGAASGAGPGGGGAGGGGESITLADVKVGDTIAGQGALKGGVFVPTTLMVGDPTQRRRRPEGAGGSASGAGTSGAAGTTAEPK